MRGIVDRGWGGVGWVQAATTPCEYQNSATESKVAVAEAVVEEALI